MTFSALGSRMSFGRFAIIDSESQGTSEGVMENLRRRERDTSATVSDEGSLVIRTRLRPPLLREDVAARRCLLDRLRDALRSHRLILIPAAPDRLE